MIILKLIELATVLTIVKIAMSAISITDGNSNNYWKYHYHEENFGPILIYQNQTTKRITTAAVT